MQVDPTPSVADELPAQALWMRRLARGLTRDDDAAGDVAQDAWVAALRAAPAGALASRPWLVRVARNLVRKRWRDEAHRERVERSAARGERTPATDDVLARLDLQRALADELRALREPYRTTLLRRYFDGWSAARIAREQGVPSATVRARVRQGLAELRARLDRRSGGDRTLWRLALLPLVKAPGPSWLENVDWTEPFAALKGALIVKTSLQLVATAALALALGVGVWWSLEPTGAAEASLAGVQPPQAAVPEPATANAAHDEPSARQDARVVEAASSEALALAHANEGAVVAPTLIVARCVDVEARPIAGVRVCEHDREPAASALSNRDGRVELAIAGDARRCVLRVESSGLTTLFVEAHVTPGATTRLGDLILAPGGSVRGRVVDIDGRPVGGARISVTDVGLWSSDIANARRFGPRTWQGAPSSFSLADGTFVVEGVPAGGARAWAGFEGMRFGVSGALNVRANEMTDAGELVVEPLAAKDEIAGVVLTPDGIPVAHASLRLRVVQRGSSTGYGARTDGEGRFRFRVMLVAPHQLSASDPQRRWLDAELFDVEPGARDVELRFGDNRYIDVTVRANGSDLPRFELITRDEADDDELERSGLLEDAHGRARVRVPNRTFVIEARAPGYAIARQGPFAPDAVPASSSFALVPEAGISGRVLANGAPVGGATVKLQRVASAAQEVEVGGYPALVEPEPSDEFQTRADGEFFLRVSEPGEYVVRVERAAFAACEHGPLHATPGVGIANLELVLGAGGAIEGRVLTEAGRSPEGVLIAINHGDGHPRTTRSDDGGHFRFERVMPGRWFVAHGKHEVVDQDESWSIGGAKKATEIPFNCDVLAGRTTHIDVDLREAQTCHVAGRLTVNGAPARGWTLTVWPGDTSTYTGELPSTAVDERGKFELDVDEPGRARFSFLPPGQQGGIDTFADLRLGANEWNAAFAMASVTGRASLAGASESLYFIARGADPTCMLALRCDEHGEFSLPFVPAGAGAFCRLEERDNGASEWVRVLEIDLKQGETRRVELP